jgi:hypothetical protein
VKKNMCVYAVPPLARGLESAAVVAPEGATPLECKRSTLSVRRRRLSVRVGEDATVSGILEEGEARAPAGSALWRTLAHASTAANGRFSLSYRTWRTGATRVRVRFPGDASAAPSARIAGEIQAFRPAEASWYGGAGTLACGGELTSSTLGVANKTLPCGTLVTLRYEGRTIRVPVVDRGPYVEGREFDLTEATKNDLGFGGVGEVWTTS